MSHAASSGDHATLVGRHPAPISLEERLRGDGTIPLPRGAWVEVDLGALIHNTLVLRRIAGDRCTFAAVLKADGYGHGIEACALAARAAGAGFLSVATLDEALYLRAIGDRGPIVVNYPVPDDGLPDAARAHVDVTAGSLRQLDAFVALGDGAPVVHLEIDTGMTRGGFEPDTVAAAARRLVEGGVRVHAAWSHLSAPEDPERTAEQVRGYESALDQLRDAGLRIAVRHISASGGLCCGAPAYEMVRVGLAFYGLHPCPRSTEAVSADRLRPALAIKARPVRISDIDAGTAVGYAGTWIAARPSRIATLPMGYADGWLRGSAPRSQALVRGRRVPVVGRISSDSMTVDVTDVPGVQEDDVFVLLGGQGGEAISAEEVATARDSITWEVLQTLSRRMPRSYTLDSSVVALRRSDAGRLVAMADLADRLEQHVMSAGREPEVHEWG